ncbi:MAG: hypothetical protein HPY90_02850 [Syntrophothermus sp.]|uniref:hypothetical protein n=1 Tax=Syntrophothermus sp. TaxID=2736299 RepID=UPI0025800FCF|nr:hypothetical protein [Syntrophothermus sp.]NSW82201.1 hypothetical protein [Syntrophothermus sp.]
MRLKDIIDYLRHQEVPVVSSQDALRTWHTHEDSLKFLLFTTDNDVPIYISGRNFFLYSLIVPLKKLGANYVEDLLKWNSTASSGYGYGYSYSKSEPMPFLSEPMEHTGSKILDDSLPVFFLRYFPGYKNREAYVEINQRISHVLDIHWVEEKHAWCKLNELGEIVPIAYWVEQDGLILCTLQKEELEFYLFLANACLVRVFDVSRSLAWAATAPENRQDDLYKDEQNEIYARRTLLGDPYNPIASIFRGFQIIRCKKPRAELLLKLKGEEPRAYASFIIWDWKHGTIREWTSDPKKLGNYFVESDLPFGTSPAFFKPDVLLRYRQDPSRYKVHDRWIECKGAWSLRYDINAEGQVHVYICDLSHLPYQEQLYWKAFNEPPKAGISLRAFKTDFEGEWDEFYDPLQSLKETLRKFPQQDEKGNLCPIWKMPQVPETRDLTFLGYVVTESRKEWEDQILALAQILVEGLNASYINKLAEARGCRDEKLGSIKQLARILEYAALPSDEIKFIIEPLNELWYLRSAIVAHAGGNPPRGDLRQHFRSLVEKCDLAMRKLSELVKTGCLSYGSD